jgi:hypothetical protein
MSNQPSSHQRLARYFAQTDAAERALHEQAARLSRLRGQRADTVYQDWQQQALAAVRRQHGEDGVAAPRILAQMAQLAQRDLDAATPPEPDMGQFQGWYHDHFGTWPSLATQHDAAAYFTRHVAGPRGGVGHGQRVSASQPGREQRGEPASTPCRAPR